ncbi:hypothetical protein [Geomonas agri]|uniref:hypothetical protein n=1 Tax=Geomonas agri TaxID=2873702 RepID=UPI001CD37A24|nr:hypothetical protein [Geomonas agri]
MAISAETLRIWGEIELKVERKIRLRMSDKVASEDVFSEVKVLFLTRNFPYKHIAQAYNYAITFLFKQALATEETTLGRFCIAETGSYTSALRELGYNPTREEIEKVEDLYRPRVTHISYEALKEEGWDQAVAELNPLNPSGLNERTSAYLANPRIAPEVKAMALQILNGDTFAEVAERHGCSVQTINRRLRQDLEELDPELLYVVNNVKRKPRKTAKAVSLPIAIMESIAEAEVVCEETIELYLDAQSPQMEAQARMAKVVDISEHLMRAGEVTEARFTTKIPFSDVVQADVWPRRLAARAVPPYLSATYHTNQNWRRIWPCEELRCRPGPAILRCKYAA